MRNGLILSVVVLVGVSAASIYSLTPDQDRKDKPVAAKVAKVAEPAKTEPEKKAAAPAKPKLVYDHFRVGRRNIKAMMSDQSLMWVGTSGGVIRYRLSDDKYKLFDNKSGLLSNGVFHLNKVNNEIWVGTYGGGLSVLNQESGTWRNYNVPNGLGDAFVYDTLKTANGDVWIATWSGANRIKGGKLDDIEGWELHTVKNTDGGLPNDWVYGLAEGKNGEIWLATEGGLARYVDNKWTNWNHQKGLGAKYDVVKADIKFKEDPGKQSGHHASQKKEQGLENVDIAYNPNYVIALAVDKDGKVWTGTWGAGLSVFDGEKWRTFTKKDGLPGNHIFMLENDPSGDLWIGTNEGLARYDGSRFELYDQNSGLFNNNVFSMAFASDGAVWVGSFGGVARYQKGLGSTQAAK